MTEGGLQAAVLTGPSELAEVSDGWRALAEAAGNAFVTREWFDASLRHYPEGKEPSVVVVRASEGELRGVLPLVSVQGRISTTYRFGGANIGSYYNVAAHPEDQAAVAAAAGRVLLRERGRAAVVLDCVDVDATWWRALQQAVGRAATVLSPLQVAPYVDLRGLSAEEYRKGLSRKLRQQLNRTTRGLEEGHGMRIRRTETAEEVDRDMAGLFRLHAERWDERGGSGAITPTSQALHAEFARAAFERGWLRMYVMEVAGEPIAILYGWRLGERSSAALSAFSPSPRWSRYSIGVIMLEYGVQAAISDGAEEFDLMLGESPYKLRLATGERRLQTLVIAARTHPAVTLGKARVGLWHVGQALPPSIRARARRVYGRVGRAPTSRER